RYTDGESANMHRDGQTYHWTRSIAHFVQDFQSYYDSGGAGRDGPHGFIYSLLSGFYRFEQHAKLFERRFRTGELQPLEREVPASVEQVLEFALQVARQKPRPPATEIRVEECEGAAEVVFCGPLNDPSGYGDGSRELLFALEEAGIAVAAQSIPWSD